MKKKSVICLLFVALFIFSTDTVAQYFEDEYDVPYVPTRYEVVDLMLEMAKVNENDILYDLGCGDGRIVVTAAKKFGTHGIGIDINPLRIKESNENAVNNGVTDKVQFIEQNLFQTDFSEATVLTLYLLPSVNLKLRPKIFRDLKPGTRIVSHDFTMGDWEPDQESELDTDGRFHNVYFWVLPANVSGTWKWSMSAGNNTNNYTLQVVQEFQQVYGALSSGSSDIPVKNFTIVGDKLQFDVETVIGGERVTQVFNGIVDGSSIDGTVVSRTGSASKNTKWKAERDPSTIVPLDVEKSDTE